MFIDLSALTVFVGKDETFDGGALDTSLFTPCEPISEGHSLCLGAVFARYVAVVASGSTQLHLCDVQVYCRSGRFINYEVHCIHKVS